MKHANLPRKITARQLGNDTEVYELYYDTDTTTVPSITLFVKMSGIDVQMELTLVHWKAS